jgi:hypothetical protein
VIINVSLLFMFYNESFPKATESEGDLWPWDARPFGCRDDAKFRVQVGF